MCAAPRLPHDIRYNPETHPRSMDPRPAPRTQSAPDRSSANTQWPAHGSTISRQHRPDLWQPLAGGVPSAARLVIGSTNDTSSDNPMLHSDTPRSDSSAAHFPHSELMKGSEGGQSITGSEGDQLMKGPEEDQSEGLRELDEQLSLVESQLEERELEPEIKAKREDLQRLEQRLAAVEMMLEALVPIDLEELTSSAGGSEELCEATNEGWFSGKLVAAAEASLPPTPPPQEQEPQHASPHRATLCEADLLISPRRQSEYSEKLQAAINDVTEKLWGRFKSSREAFLFLDADRSGAIDKCELQEMLKAHNMPADAANQILNLFGGPEIKAGDFIKMFAFK